MARLKPDALFDYLFEQGFQPEYAEEGSEIAICCPLCGDDRPRLYANAEHGAWTCFHCHESGSLHRLLLAVCELDGSDAFEAGRLLRQREEDDDLDDYFELREDKARARDPSTELRLPLQFHPVDEQTPMIFADYLARRHVSKELAREFGIGYAVTGRYAYRVIVPVCSEEPKLLTFIARTVLSQCPHCTNRLDDCTCRPRKFPKVLTPRSKDGARPSAGLFNLGRIRGAGSQRLVVCEGVFDALRRPDESVALLGSTASQTQLALLAELARSGRSCILALDGDDAGYRGVLRIAPALAAELVTVRVALLPDGSDPSNLPAEEYERCLRKARAYVI